MSHYKTLIVLAAAAAAPAVAWADVAFNASVVSDYRYRGISQSRLKPAVQGGVDFSQGAFYLGAWASTIKWIKDVPGGGAGVEVDVYGGLKGELAKDLNYDVGFLAYVYNSNRLNPSANTTELYGALTYGPATLKYSHAVTNTFANADSKNSFYLDLSASFEVMDGWSLAPHIGYQKIKGPFDQAASYTDVALTLSKDFKGVVPSIALVSTDADKNFYVPGANANSTKFLGKTGLVLGVKVNF
ncbi:MAG: TorF family putative porin [Aquabacterium sp.]